MQYIPASQLDKDSKYLIIDSSLIFMIWCAYSISMPSFWREIQIVMRSFYVSWESSRQLNNQRLLPSQETKLETVALLTFKSDYQLDFRTLDIHSHTPKEDLPMPNRLKTWSLQFYLSKENQFHQDSSCWKHSGKPWYVLHTTRCILQFEGYKGWVARRWDAYS